MGNTLGNRLFVVHNRKHVVWRMWWTMPRNMQCVMFRWLHDDWRGSTGS
jgi:hypothetical protein